ncbi:hypothetical protein H4R33_006698, partial [Dimargaris cristalligena]
VFRWADAVGSPSLNLINDLIIKQLHGTNLGRWNALCKLYREVSLPTDAGQPNTTEGPSNKGSKVLLLLTDSLQPAKQHAMIDDAVVQTDREFESVIQKLKNLWVLRQTSHIDGHHYDLGDFTIRAGHMVVGTSNKGVIFEVEYKPSSAIHGAQALLAELIGILMPPEAQLSFAQPLRNPTPSAEMGIRTPGLIPTSQLIHHRYLLETNYGPAGITGSNYNSLHSTYQLFSLFRKDSLL